MPHITPLADDKAPEPVRATFQSLKKALGADLNIFRSMAHAADVLDATLKLNGAIQQHLPGKLRELAYLKTSMLNQCDY